jgi:2-dehydro-3-deoxygluconokinase
MLNRMNKNIVCFGEVLLRLSSPGKELLLQSPRFDAHVGGAEANVAVSLSRLGHRTAVVTALPDSSLGRVCADELRRHSVDLSGVRYREGRMGTYFLTHGAGHRPSEVLYDREYSSFATAPADLFDWPTLLSGAAWLHVSGITPAVSSAAAQSALRAVTAARSAGVKVAFDCNFRARVWGSRTHEAPALLAQLCGYADLIFGDDRDIAFMLGFDSGNTNGTERQRLAGKVAFDRFASLQWIASTGRTRHSVDVQEISGLLQSRSDVFVTPAYPLHGIVDRIGAGDAFAAGVLHGLISGLGPQNTIRFATAAACLKHSIPGDFNLATAADIELVLAEHRTDVRR